MQQALIDQAIGVRAQLVSERIRQYLAADLQLLDLLAFFRESDVRLTAFSMASLEDPGGPPSKPLHSLEDNSPPETISPLNAPGKDSHARA